ncbi:MAG: IS3 family transposase [Cyanobacteria bacterium]|nr:IS3 family transposase [Cyanobacteria bacterium bin.51]
MAWLCRQLGVARSGYYAWRQRQEAPGKRAAENGVNTAEIQAVLREHRGFYGSPRIHQELRAAGHPVGRHRVARLMQRAELLEWWRTCCSRTSSPRLRTAAGRATSPTSAPQPAGGTWPSGSICSAAVSSAGSSITGWMPLW